ncbi:MAG: hypothetical protein WCT04_00195 [Planctomycetota bacterium]
MSTDVTTSSPGSNNAPIESSKSGSSGGWSVHKPGEGYATRLGLMAVVFAFVTFSARQWYYNWIFIPKFFRSLGLGILLDWTESYRSFSQIGGTLIIASLGFLLGYYYIYIRRDSAEFLVKTDMELAKVTWPKVSPWFRPDTQVWGATYVVLIVITMLTLYVLTVDSSLEFFASKVFFSK